MYRRINLATGLFIEDVILSPDDEITEDLISSPVPQGFYIPKWTGTRWIEGATQEYIDGLNGKTPQPTTEEKLEELANALLIQQKQLETSQEALDFVIMGGE